jgi:uncharacterized protein YbgA (DUF1722 family)
VCIALVQSWIIRFKQPYLQQQSFFNPYPTALGNLYDTSHNHSA